MLSLPANLGAGGAMSAGYRFASEQGFDVAVRLDADGQHDARDLPALLAALDDGADLVIGSLSGAPDYQVGIARQWAMRRLSGQVSRLTGLSCTDTTSGYRATGRRAIALYAQESDPRFLGDTVEALVDAVAAGPTVAEVPVRMRARQCGQASIGLWRSQIGFVRTTRELQRAVTLGTQVPAEPVGILHTKVDR